jgi:Domain of unknown function (DUF6817)/2OG-Fe(II) oxygenase superfamily
MQQAITYIATAETRRRPFRYFISQQVLSPDSAGHLLHWLETGAPWHLHQGAFFEQYECNLLGVPTPSGCAPLFGQKELNELKGRMEALLGTELADRIEIVAHKLLPSQGIGIHNDEPHDDLETHRFILQINRGWSDENGGHLLLFNSKNPSDIHAVVRPTHNTGIGFAMSDRSYHAVSDVRHGIRYTVIYSFWKKQTRRADALHDEVPIGRELRQVGRTDLDAFEKHNIGSMLRFLRSAGAHETHHSGKDLLKHLTNTYRILRRWGCPEYLCVAGLFHSVYGTEAFRHAMFGLRQRQLIRDRIGPDAEHAAYLYCVATRRSLYENLEREALYSLRTVRDGTRIPISRKCLADLIALDLANSLEQLTRIPLTPKMVETDRTIYEKAIPLLPGAAIVEMHWVYQSRNITPEELPLEARLAMLDLDAQARIERVLRETLAREQN